MVTTSAATVEPATETIHLQLLRRTSAKDEVLAESDQTITTSSGSSTQSVSLHPAPLEVGCGDPLVLRVTHPTGRQTLFPFQVALDLP